MARLLKLRCRYRHTLSSWRRYNSSKACASPPAKRSMRASSVSAPSVMYALSHLPEATGRWIRYEVREWRARKRIGILRYRRGARNDSERDQILPAVIADAHELIG